MLAGLIPSVGAVGDALDNALADLEEITTAWVHWYNTSRLMHRLDRRPPAEAKAEYYAHHRIEQHTDHT